LKKKKKKGEDDDVVGHDGAVVKVVKVVINDKVNLRSEQRVITIHHKDKNEE